MKPLKYFLMLIIFAGMPLINAYAQGEPEPPEEPAPIRNVRWHAFELDEKTEKEYLKKMDADLKKDLLDIKKDNKEKYFELLMESEFAYFRVPHISYEEKETYERNQKISELEVRTQVLAHKYSKSNEAEKQKIKADLSKKLNDLFELREKDRKYQIDQLEKEIKELRESISVRRKNKKLIISRRLQELVGEDKYLDWD